MRGRRLREWVSWIGLLSVFLLYGPAPAAMRGLLYEVRSEAASAPSFLFGTIHSEDPRVTRLPAPVSAAFDAATGFALEVVPDAAGIIKAMVTMTYTDGRGLREMLPSDLYRETAAALAGLGMSEEAFKDFKPWAVMTLLSVPPARTGEFLDIMLYRTAVGRHKPIQGLESMEEQLSVFDDLALADQIALLRETLASRHQLRDMFDRLMMAYLARDLDGLLELSDAYLDASDPRLARLFKETVVESRNRRMVERMVPLIGQGGWFIAIGALHLPGDSGVLESLRRLGYSVSVVY